MAKEESPSASRTSSSEAGIQSQEFRVRTPVKVLLSYGCYAYPYSFILAYAIKLSDFLYKHFASKQQELALSRRP